MTGERDEADLGNSQAISLRANRGPLLPLMRSNSAASQLPIADIRSLRRIFGDWMAAVRDNPDICCGCIAMRKIAQVSTILGIFTVVAHRKPSDRPLLSPNLIPGPLWVLLKIFISLQKIAIDSSLCLVFG